MADIAARVGRRLRGLAKFMRGPVRIGRQVSAAPSRTRTLALDLALVGATCALLWAGIGLLLHQQRAYLLRESVQDSDNLVRAFQENTIRTLDAIDRTLLFLRSSYTADPDHFDLATWDRDAQVLDNITLQIGLIDANGLLRASNLGPVREPLDLSDREHFRAQRESAWDALFISKPVLGRGSGRWSVQFTRKILGPGGAFAGVAVVSVDPFSLARFYASLDLGGGSVLLMGLDGIVRTAAPVGAGMLGRDLGASPLLAAARRAPRGLVEMPGELMGAGDGTQIVSFRRLDRYGLVVAVGLDRAEVFASYVRSRAEYGIGGGCLTLLILLVGSSVIARRQALMRTQERLVRSQEVLTDTLENMSQGIFMVDAARRIAVINRRAIELLGLPPGLISAGASFDDLLRWQLRNGEFDNDAAVRRLAESGGIELTDSVYERTRPNGMTLEVRTRVLSSNRAVRTFTDLTERKRAEARISYLAHHDALTGLANRASFQDRLTHAVSVGRRGGTAFAVLCLDLDRFKQVNDTRGHDMGDQLLQAVAERLRASVREGDAVARFGGDEFAILQTDVEQPEAAAALAERLVAHVAEPYAIDGIQVSIGVSVGIALYPADGLTADHLLKSADIALYKAKEDGRGTSCFFEPAMDAALQERYALEQDFRGAVTQDRIDVHFQPICDAQSGRAVAYEALARWTHPDRGPISPQVFVPVAEEAGLVGALGRAVLRKACREAAGWPSDLGLTVNLSPVQLLDTHLAAQVLGILDETGLDPGRLGLEVTEGALIRNGEEALATLRALRRQGVRIYLDDFGTGHAGLSYLLRFPFDCIKIDRSFVGRLATDRAAEAVIRATLLLGESLGIEVVAEGIETGAQRARLVELGCRRLQGYLLGVPARDVAERGAPTDRDGGLETASSRHG